MIKLLSTFTFLLLCSPCIYGQQNFITLDAFKGAVNIEYEGKTGTGFFVTTSNGVDTFTHIVTAKHILASPVGKAGFYKGKFTAVPFDTFLLKDHENIQIKINENGEWKPLMVKILTVKGRLIDQVILETKLKMHQAFNFDTTTTVPLGQDVYFLGYPGISTNSTIFKTQYSLPLLRRAMMSGSMLDDDNNAVIILDGNNTQGFSGGPVLVYDQTNKSFKVIGVISGYRNRPAPVKDGLDTVGIFEENTGSIIVYPIKHVLDVLYKR